VLYSLINIQLHIQSTVFLAPSLFVLDIVGGFGIMIFFVVEPSLLCSWTI